MALHAFMLIIFPSLCVYRSPSLGACMQLPHIPVTAFSQTDLCFSLNLSRIQTLTLRSLSKQVRTLFLTDVFMSLED